MMTWGASPWRPAACFKESTTSDTLDNVILYLCQCLAASTGDDDDDDDDDDALSTDHYIIAVSPKKEKLRSSWVSRLARFRSTDAHIQVIFTCFINIFIFDVFVTYLRKIKSCFNWFWTCVWLHAAFWMIVL